MKENNELYPHLSIRRLFGDIIIYIILVYIEIKMIVYIVNDNNLISEFTIATIAFTIFALTDGIRAIKYANLNVGKVKRILLYLSITANIVYLATTFILICLFLYRLIASN